MLIATKQKEALAVEARKNNKLFDEIAIQKYVRPWASSRLVGYSLCKTS